MGDLQASMSPVLGGIASFPPTTQIRTLCKCAENVFLGINLQRGHGFDLLQQTQHMASYGILWPEGYNLFLFNESQVFIVHLLCCSTSSTLLLRKLLWCRIPLETPPFPFHPEQREFTILALQPVFRFPSEEGQYLEDTFVSLLGALKVGWGKECYSLKKFKWVFSSPEGKKCKKRKQTTIELPPSGWQNKHMFSGLGFLHTSLLRK